MSSDQRLSRPSILELVPHEPGGVPARRGFRIQDHVATGFLIQMNADTALIAVYCEAADDILLLWKRSEVEVVGATNTCYLLVACNYVLLAMTGDAGNLYPGLSVIDLPANMSDVKVMKDQENYLIEPFSRLLEQPRYKECQLVAVGHAYDNIPNANRIEFKNVFSAPDTEEEDSS